MAMRGMRPPIDDSGDEEAPFHGYQQLEPMPRAGDRDPDVSENWFLPNDMGMQFHPDNLTDPKGPDMMIPIGDVVPMRDTKMPSQDLQDAIARAGQRLNELGGFRGGGPNVIPIQPPAPTGKVSDMAMGPVQMAGMGGGGMGGSGSDPLARLAAGAQQAMSNPQGKAQFGQMLQDPKVQQTIQQAMQDPRMMQQVFQMLGPIVQAMGGPQALMQLAQAGGGQSIGGGMPMPAGPPGTMGPGDQRVPGPGLPNLDSGQALMGQYLRTQQAPTDTNEENLESMRNPRDGQGPVIPPGASTEQELEMLQQMMNKGGSR